MQSIHKVCCIFCKTICAYFHFFSGVSGLCLQMLICTLKGQLAFWKSFSWKFSEHFSSLWIIVFLLVAQIQTTNANSEHVKGLTHNPYTLFIQLTEASMVEPLIVHTQAYLQGFFHWHHVVHQMTRPTSVFCVKLDVKILRGNGPRWLRARVLVRVCVYMWQKTRCHRRPICVDEGWVDWSDVCVCSIKEFSQ